MFRANVGDRVDLQGPHSSTDMMAWNAIFLEESARTRSFFQVDGSEKEGAGLALDFKDSPAVRDDPEVPRVLNRLFEKGCDLVGEIVDAH